MQDPRVSYIFVILKERRLCPCTPVSLPRATVKIASWTDFNNQGLPLEHLVVELRDVAGLRQPAHEIKSGTRTVEEM